jgi:uncharacterized protein (TIGR03067 family)
MRIARAALVLSLASLLGASQAKKEEAGDIKGDWSIVSMKMGDKSAPADMIKGLAVSFDGQGYTNKSSDQVVEQGTYQLDTAKTPWTIDFTIKKGPDAGKRQLGLIAVDGKTLTLCVADAGSEKRPTSLEPTPGSPAMVVVMKRAMP